MKNKFLYLAILSIFTTSLLSADALKNSLTNMLNEKDSTPNVNLSHLNLDGKPRVVKHTRKRRSSKAVVAVVNGHKFIKKSVDAYLKKITHGKVRDFDMLPLAQKRRLIKEMALPNLALVFAKKELSKDEKLAAYSKEWMQKESLKVKISNNEVKKVYDSLKAKALNGKADSNKMVNFPSFRELKVRIKSQMIEKQIVDKLMENVKINISK